MWCIESIRSTSRAIHTRALFSRFTSFAAWNIANYDKNKIQNDTRSRTRFRCYVMSVLKIKCSLKCMSAIRRRKRMYTNEWTFAVTAFHFVECTRNYFEVQMWFTFTNHTDCIESWINGFIKERGKRDAQQVLNGPDIHTNEHVQMHLWIRRNHFKHFPFISYLSPGSLHMHVCCDSTSPFVNICHSIWIDLEMWVFNCWNRSIIVPCW